MRAPTARLHARGDSAILKGVHAPILALLQSRRELELRPGAQVLLTRSIRPRKGLVNGARGVVERFVGSAIRLPVVRFANVSACFGWACTHAACLCMHGWLKRALPQHGCSQACRHPCSRGWVSTTLAYTRAASLAHVLHPMRKWCFGTIWCRPKLLIGP